jgi:N-carbamoylputrescine amidase
MKVTVCQLHDQVDAFAEDWARLCEHLTTTQSTLVLLPEMPFYPWWFATPKPDLAVWEEAVMTHAAWLTRLHELRAPVVLGTAPANKRGLRLNEAFVWDGEYRPAHEKFHLPNEEGFYEGAWYSRGDNSFRLAFAGAARVGFSLCSEIWFTQHARHYGKLGAHIIASPRATEKSSVDTWLVAGRATAIIAGAYSLSSNRVSADGAFGGAGWVIDPKGTVLAVTSQAEPFITIEIDLQAADAAKSEYPCYMPD